MLRNVAIKAKDTIVRARVNTRVKQNAEDTLSKLGLTMSDAINLLLNQINLSKGLPFEVKIPNKKTQKTLRESAAGKNVKKFSSTDALFKDLGI